MKILLIEPYFTGSHAAWATGYQRHGRHDIEILSMEGRYWKWRMHGGAVTLAKKFIEGNYLPDLILATDMLDLTTFLSLTRSRTAPIPTAVYFHENQLTYPWSPDDRDVAKNRDKHYGFINYSTALTADAVFFNSKYNMESFICELKGMLKNFPDYNEVETIDEIASKSSILPLGLDLSALETAKETPERSLPLVLWNHRWEHDKNPAEFFKALYLLKEKGLEFEVAILGENFRKQPVEFEEAKEKLGNQIVHFGYAEDFSAYANWLWQADILPVTSRHDFFGASVVEAMHCNTFPILPRRLAYPEHIPEEFHEEFFYDSFDDLMYRLEAAIMNVAQLRKKDIGYFVKRYDWKEMATAYDEVLEKAISPQRHKGHK